MNEFDDLHDENYTAADIDSEHCLDIGDGVYVVSLIPEAPVEYSGIVGDQCFHFKSRGQRWQLTIGASLHDCTQGSVMPDNDKVLFQCAGKIPGNNSEASYMPTDVAEVIIRSAIELWQFPISTEEGSCGSESTNKDQDTVYVPFHIEPLKK